MTIILVLLLGIAGALSIGLAHQGIISPNLADAWQVHAGVMALGFMQVLAFVLVSRARNRSDDRYHAIAAIGSNGVWYLTFNSVFFFSLFQAARPDSGNIPYEMIVPFLVGSIAGGMMAAHYSQKIENWLEAHAGPRTKGENLDKQTFRELLAGQTREVQNRWWLYTILLGCALFFAAIAASPGAVLGFVLLAYGQNIAFALGSRSRNRNSALYIVFTSILGTLALFFVWRVLVVKGMPLELFAPYTAATVLGSITGARVSVIIERLYGIIPDEHMQKKMGDEEVKREKEERAKRERMLWGAVLSVGALAMFATPFVVSFTFLGLSLVVLAAFLNSGVHILASRASNRNHMPYNFVTRLFWGFGWFFLTALAVYYEMSYAILAPYMLGSILGNLFGFKLAVFFETKLKAVMEVEPQTAKA